MYRGREYILEFMTPGDYGALPQYRRHTGLDGRLYVLHWTDRGTALAPVELVGCIRCAEDPLADMATKPGELPPHGPRCPSSQPSV